MVQTNLTLPIHAIDNRIRRASAVFAPLLLLAGCASVPQGNSPPQGGLGVLPAQASLANDSDNPMKRQTGLDATWPEEGWWHSYADQQLPTLITEGLAHSPDVALAAARMRKAAAMAGTAKAALLPSLDAVGQAGLTKISYNEGYPPQFVTILPHGWNTEGELAGNFNFDPDIWGKNRAALAAAISERRAAMIDESAARLALASAITDTYMSFAGVLAMRDDRAAALANREATAKLVTMRFEQGLETRASVAAAEAASATARADLASATSAVREARHALAALMGAGPDRGLTIATPQLAPPSFTTLPLDATADLLARRPDIAAARARAEAAGAEVRVARASFFPAISLQALVGYESLGLSQLLASGSSFGTVGPALSLPIFHGGELRAQYRGARADHDAAIADYNRTVVAAYQQVADAVSARAGFTRQRDEASRAAAATEEAYHLIRARYQGGLSPYLDVLASEDRWLQARAALVASDTAARQSDVALIRSLGGGYRDNYGHHQTGNRTNKARISSSPQDIQR